MAPFDISTLFVPEKQLLAHLRKKAYRPAAIFDIGASTGVWSECISQVVPESSYFLFEPLAGIVDEYKRDLKSRLQRFPEWRLFPVAVGESRGHATVFVARDGYGSSCLNRGECQDHTSRGATSGSVDVPLWPLDEFVRQHALPRPSVIKMDCQGYEACIIRGGADAVRNADILLLETWLKRSYGPDTPLLPEISALVGELGFRLVGYGEHFYDDRGELYSVDAFYAAPRLAALCEDAPGYWTGAPGRESDQRLKSA